MALRLTGDMPLSEPIMAYFTDAYMRRSESMSLLSPSHALEYKMKCSFSIGNLFSLYRELIVTKENNVNYCVVHVPKIKQNNQIRV